MADFIIRPWQATDSVDKLTELLHRSYAGLAAMGLRYWATHQSADITRKRIEGGECFVAADDTGTIRGTIVFRNTHQTSGCPWYDRPDVACFGQLAVDPALQKNGLGLRLLSHVETRAREAGVAELALDTAEPATHLVNWYTRLGYRFIEHTQWNHTNSVVLSKTL